MPNHRSNPSNQMGWIAHIRAVLTLAFVILNLSFWILPLTVLMLAKWLLPFPGVRSAIYRVMARIYQIAVGWDSWVLFRVMGINITLTGDEMTFPGQFYLAMANHQSWSDILILQHLFNRNAPILKFLVKRELIYLPIVGLICWAYDFPFLHRRGSQQMPPVAGPGDDDARNLSKALTLFLRSSATIMNFAEGTRYTTEKAEKQRSPYRHLLKPRAGGLATILEILGDRLAAVLDITIVYDTGRPHFWHFLAGRISNVRVHVRTIAAREIFAETGSPADADHAKKVAGWINQQWASKDRRITRISADFKSP